MPTEALRTHHAVNRPAGRAAPDESLKALHIWVYDYLPHAPLAPYQVCHSPYAEMSFDDICGEILALHDRVLNLYRSLEGRAEIPGSGSPHPDSACCPREAR